MENSMVFESFLYLSVKGSLFKKTCCSKIFEFDVRRNSNVHSGEQTVGLFNEQRVVTS